MLNKAKRTSPSGEDNQQSSVATIGAYVTVEHLLQFRYCTKDLTVATRKKSTSIIDGESHTQFRGRGMEFAEVRPYQPGDDIRNIDWRVTARTTQPYTKLFQEERERPVLIVIDQRSPMFFGSHSVFKSVAATEMAAGIAWIALQNNDRIGALIFGDHDQYDLRAKRGKHAALALINQLHAYNLKLNSPVNPSGSDTSCYDIFSDLRRVAKPGSAVFVLSDFHDFDGACEEPLSMLSRHTDVNLLSFSDPLERSLPTGKELTVSNNQERLTLHANTHNFLNAYNKAFTAKQASLRTSCLNSGAGFHSLDIATPSSSHLRELFSSKRGKRKGGVR